MTARASGPKSGPTVLCFGEALWDLPPGGRTPGGAPMNVALHLVRFGADVRLLSRVGDDELGRELLGYIGDQGLDPDFVQVDPRHPTGRVRVDTSDPLAMRYEIEAPAAWDFIDADAYRARSGRPDDVLVFGSLAARNRVSRTSLETLLTRAESKVFDVNLRPPFDGRDVVEPLLAAADWVKLNEEELERVAGWNGDPAAGEDALSALAARHGLSTVCVTLGHRGAVMLHQGRVVRQSGFEVPVVDTIGCGDAFLACWLSAMLTDANPTDALARACAVGALVASRAGANPELREDEIRALAGSRGVESA